jgi:hypothetical protein
MVADRPIVESLDRYNTVVRASNGVSALLALVFLVGAATACTFLVQFHDEAISSDGGATLDASLDASTDAGTPVLEAEAGPDTYAPCGPPPSPNLASGYYCATDGLHGYVGSAADLIYCDDGGIGKVTHCDGGCLPLPAPYPDACNPCPGVADGLYCGRDLAGFPADNADFLIQCQTDNAVMTVACAHGCDSDGTTSSCYP